MSLPVLFLVIGFTYILIWGVLSILRREGHSLRFILESVVITLISFGLAQWGGIQMHPVLFFLILYLITMRVRILVDLGSLFDRRGQFHYADGLYRLADKLWPDATNRLILRVNQGTSLLQQKKLDDAIGVFTAILQQANQEYLGVKYEAATHYNLGVAYLRKGMDARASIAFNAVIDTWPASVYAQRAEVALQTQRRKANPKRESAAEK